MKLYLACRQALYSFCTITFLSFLLPGIAQADESLSELKALSLDALMDVEITIAGKTPQKVGDVPAAVYVVSQEDIQRMGATNIPEALRMVPGLNVGHIDANKWAIGIRGFSQLYANHLLVMIDGRTIYTPLFSGVNWDAQDMLMEDIERIEVIRGPGATVWGANAVNGVINIITKSADDTQGTLLTGTIGTEQGIVGGRHGGKLSEDAHYRVYAKYRDHDDAEFLDGTKATDGFEDIRAGFRMDWQANEKNQITIQGDTNVGELGTRKSYVSPVPPFWAPVDHISDVFGANLLARWSKEFDSGATQELQAYYDYAFRDSWLLKSKRGTLDIDYQYHLAPTQRHDLVLGAGYRYIHDELPKRSLTEATGFFDPEKRQDHLFSVFFQDDISLIEDSLWLTIGSKFQHNDYSGFEVQPSVRLRWKPEEGKLLWASISRAVRTPSRFEHDGQLVVDELLAPGLFAALTSNQDFEPEELIAYELGYRFQVHESLNADLTLFYNDYDKVITYEFAGVQFPPELGFVPTVFVSPGNHNTDEAYGVEVALDWQHSDDWNTRASYSYLKVLTHNRPESLAQTTTFFEGSDPNHQFNLLSSYQFTDNLSVNLFGYYKGRRPSVSVASFVDLDLGMQWKPSKDLTLSLFGRNLLHENRLEFQQTAVAPEATQVERQVYLKFDWRF